MKKIIATAVGSALLSGGAILTTENIEITALKAQTSDLKAEKHAVLMDNVWKDVRLGIPPEYNIDVDANISIEEMTEAYSQLANEKNAKTKADLYTALREKAIEQGVECK